MLLVKIMSELKTNDEWNIFLLSISQIYWVQGSTRMAHLIKNRNFGAFGNEMVEATSKILAKTHIAFCNVNSASVE